MNNPTICINIATHKGREKNLKQALKSLLAQNIEIEEINVYLNDYDNVPKWLSKLKVNAVLGKDKRGELKDAGKYFFSDTVCDFYFTCDDDIIYPENYCRYLRDVISNNPKSIVGFDGTKLNRLFEVVEKWPFYGGNDITRIVDLLGSGCLGFVYDECERFFEVLLGLPFNNAQETNIDAELALFANQNDMPMICPVHASNWISAQKVIFGGSISDNNDHIDKLKKVLKGHKLKKIKSNIVQ